MTEIIACEPTAVTHRFLVTLVDGDREHGVDLMLNSGSFAAIRAAIRAHFPPQWKIYESLLKWEDCF
jgi:hypothetical protein